MQFTNIKHQTNYWCRTLGINSSDLDNHPQMDDVVLLIHFRDLAPLLNNQERNFLLGCWESTYKQKWPIKPKTMAKLENLAVTVGIRQKQIEAKRNLIKQRRNQ
jgi:hypothetical protein